MRWSRIMKLVAEVSSSISNAEAPASTASTREAAWEVEPEALVVEKLRESVREGRPLMKGEMSTPATERPYSARMEATSRRVITHSQPPLARWADTQRSMPGSRVDLPW